MFVSVLLGAVNCTLDERPGFDQPHFHRRDNGSGNDVQEEDCPVFVCTAAYPEDYDWRKDSARIREGCRVCLWRGEKLLLELKTGEKERVSPDPDTHHLSGGSLVTEYSDKNGTCIKCDGKVIAEYPEMEKLCGLLKVGEDIYTLGRSMSGEGFSLRKNGEAIEKRETGMPVGDLGGMCRGSGGALEWEDGTVSFYYCANIGGNNWCFQSKGGSDAPVFGAEGIRFLDARSISGKTVYIYSREDKAFLVRPDGKTVGLSLGKNISWQDARITGDSGNLLITGSVVIKGSGSPVTIVFSPPESILEAISGICFAYPGPQSFFINITEDRSLVLTQGLKRTLDGPVFFASELCACKIDDKIYIGINPYNGRDKPYLWQEGKKVGYDLNGYISCIEADISPPN